MKKKTAKRWLSRNRWKIAKFNLGFLDPGTQFHKQILRCKRVLGNILFRYFKPTKKGAKNACKKENVYQRMGVSIFLG